MSAIKVAFKFVDDRNTKLPPGYQTICGHIIWDIKMEDLRRKARYEAQALNVTEMKLADIENAYLMAPLASSGAAFRNYLADCISWLGYISSLLDRDAW
eukprot:8862995-Ditylum_brightwellii.AAC.1